VSLKPIYLVTVSLLISLSTHSHAAEKVEGVSVQEVTRHFRDSQQLLNAACKTKSIEGALKALNKADESVKKAKAILQSRKSEGEAETRMKSRLMYKLDQDIHFLNQLRSDLGMAEVDPFESYLILRKALIQDPEQRSNVVRMDHQILLTLEARSFN
jgi:hypothetical protein